MNSECLFSFNLLFLNLTGGIIAVFPPLPGSFFLCFYLFLVYISQLNSENSVLRLGFCGQ